MHKILSQNVFEDTFIRGNMAPLPRWTKVFSALAARISASIKRNHNRRIAIRTLQSMPNELLRDIGIERHQIKDVVTNFGTRSK